MEIMPIELTPSFCIYSINIWISLQENIHLCNKKKSPELQFNCSENPLKLADVLFKRNSCLLEVKNNKK